MDQATRRTSSRSGNVERPHLDEHGIFNARAITLLAGAAIGMFGGFAIMVPLSLSVFLKPMASELGWTRTQGSLLITVSMLGMTLSFPILASLIERIGARRMLILGYAVLISCLLTMAALPNVLALFLLTCLFAGLASSITTPVGFLLIITGSFDRRLGLALGCAMIGLGLGAFLIPIAAGHLILSVGWRGSLVVMAGISLLLGTISISTVFRILPARLPSKVRTEANREAQPLLPLILSRQFWMIGLPLLGTSIAAAGASAHIPAALSDRGMRPEDVALAAGLVGSGVFVGRLGAAMLMDRLFAPMVILGCFLLGAIGIQMLLNAPLDIRWAALLGVFLTGLITGTDGDVAPVLTRRYFGPDGFQRLFGLMFVFYGAGGVIGPVLAGYSFDRSGDYTLFFNFAAITCVVSGLTVLGLGRYRFPPT